MLEASMLFDIAPLSSKRRINIAGERIRNGTSTAEDLVVIENWRASHAHILNTFQATLRRRSKGKSVTVAQRLKRRTTIFDKLSREPGMQLARMNDVAGCRLIFQNQEDLFQFRNSLHSARFKHVLKNGDDDRYNYIERPKDSGYRGVHDVYQYKGLTEQGAQWDGLLLEIQYRTVNQHAWATAVEVADFIDTTRIKFGDTDKTHLSFFQLASELIARQFEGQRSCHPDLTNKELVQEFKKVDGKIRLLDTFGKLKISGGKDVFNKNVILIIPNDKNEKLSNLKVLSFSSMSSAITRYGELEREYADTDADIVLVRANSGESIREAFRNYFSDVIDFVRLINGSCENLKSKPDLL
jgi:putative GTP pyrophosphokinase